MGSKNENYVLYFNEYAYFAFNLNSENVNKFHLIQFWLIFQHQSKSINVQSHLPNATIREIETIIPEYFMH